MALHYCAVYAHGMNDKQFVFVDQIALSASKVCYSTLFIKQSGYIAEHRNSVPQHYRLSYVHAPIVKCCFSLPLSLSLTLT